eukprot:g6125.t1
MIRNSLQTSSAVTKLYGLFTAMTFPKYRSDSERKALDQGRKLSMNTPETPEPAEQMESDNTGGETIIRRRGKSSYRSY